MRVLFCYPFYGLGGVETSILSKLAALRERGIDAEALLLQPYASGGQELAETPHVTAGLDWREVPAHLHRGFDCIIAIDAPEVVDLCEIERLAVPLLVETHVSYVPAYQRLYSRISSALVQAVIVPSQFNRAQVRASTGTDKPIHVIPNPLEKDWIGEPPVERLQRGSGRSQLLWVGRLEEAKDPEAFIRVGCRLLERGRPVDLIVVGDSPEYRNARRRLVERIPPHMRERFTFLRVVPHRRMKEVYELVAASGGCLVSTSRNESLPMTFMEAMAVGCPVVSSAVGGVEDLITDGETGFLFPATADEVAVAVIERLLDPALDNERLRVTTRAQARIRERADPAVIAAAYRTAIEEALVRFPRRKRRDDALAAHKPHGAAASIIKDVHSEIGAESPVPGLVSVILPVFNRLSLLQEAVASVLEQTYQNFELLLIDDGSEASTATYCDRVAAADSRVAVVHIDHLGRPGLVREEGRRRARGEFIQYLDSDDLLHPRKLEVMVRALEQDPEADIAYCYTRRYTFGERAHSVPAELTGRTFPTMFPWSLVRRFWFTSTPLYRRRVSDANGPWSDLPFLEDVEYDARIARRNPTLVHCPEFLADVRDHDLGRASRGSFVTDPETLQWGIEAHRSIFRHARDWGMGAEAEPMRLFLEDVRLLQEKSAEFGLTEQSRLCDALIREVLPEGLPVARLAASIEPLEPELEAEPGQTVTTSVRVVNTSNISLRYGVCPHGLSYHLCSVEGETIQFENPRSYFLDPLRPGETRQIEVSIQAPTTTGKYVVQFDLVWETITWFADRGSPTSTLELMVSEGDAEPPEERFDRWLHEVRSSNA